jgi:hypothetical protein
MSQIHQNFILPIQSGIGGLNIPKAGQIKVRLVRALGLSPMPNGIMVHMTVEGEPSSGNLLLPAGSQPAAGQDGAPTWEFACVSDGAGLPEGFNMFDFVGSVAIPPGVGLHIYMRLVD